MTTFKDDILEVADGEAIEKIVIGAFGWNDLDTPDNDDAYGFDRNKRIPTPQELKGKPISWEQASQYLDYHYDSGYGSPECHAIYAWTANKVIFVSEYDGSTHVNWIPRNPADCKPGMPGGG